MPGLPQGTVTFLFTDIEGSTRLLRRLGDGYAELLGHHDRLIRAACAEHGGREFGTQGDAFFVAFSRATDAVAAAVEVQRALEAESWPENACVRVRIGLHTGEPTVSGDNYVGLAVHRAARICAVGHGGQILLSGATRAVLEDDPASTLSLRDLGPRRLKDFDRPEHLFQVLADGLPADLPPPVTVAVAPRVRSDDGDLPALPNRTVGRGDDVRAIADQVRSRDVKLLTLTGPGGVGKTRLAVEAARAAGPDFVDRVVFVSLAPMRRAEDLPPALVQALGIVVLAGETSEQAVGRFLAPKRLLLVLDNFEHLPAAAWFVADLLTASPGLTVLATSRQPLGLHAERCHPVTPLPLPAGDAPADVSAFAAVAAVALFCERARAHDPGFALDDDNAAAVADVCRRVDGLPLAIELAAARCVLLSPAEIAARLAASVGALGAGPRDAPARQQTLRATIDWSHDLLTEAERACFARFAVFAGGATVDAAETITGASLDTIDHLVSKSLLVRREHAGTRTRLGMLETVRSYAAERFASAPDADAVRERHYRVLLALARRHGADRTIWAAGARDHLARMDAEIDNLHAALEWAVGRGSAERALAMTAALGCYWYTRVRHADAAYWVDRALGLPGADAHPALCAQVLHIKHHALWTMGRASDQSEALAQADAIARELGEPAILSQALQDRSDYEALPRPQVARALADEALACARAAGDEWLIAAASRARAKVAPKAELREAVDRAAALLTEAGNVFELAGLLGTAGYGALWEGLDQDALAYTRSAVAVARDLDYPGTWMFVQGNFGLAALLTGDTTAAGDAFRDELALAGELVARPFAFEGFLGLAAVAAACGDARRAAQLAGAAAACRCAPEDPVEARLHSTFLEPARQRCGDQIWDEVARDGATLSLENAIAYALQEPPA